MPDLRLDLQQQLLLSQQVARLVRAKLPLVGELTKATAAFAPQHSKSAEAVEAELAGGKSLARSLAADTSRDSRILGACIEAGERADALDGVLESWTEMHIANSRSSKAMRAAMIYPCLLILVTILSLSFVIWKLIFEYQKTYLMFSQELPNWLVAIVRVREQLGPLMILMLLLLGLPLWVWFWRRRSFDKDRIPREPARRLRLQALASDLARFLIMAGVPLQEVVALSTRAMDISDEDGSRMFERLRQQQPLSPLPQEVSMLLAALHAGLIGPREAAQHLAAVADHLRQSAEVISTRHARWLPMLVALVVGGLILLIYVFLIYLPWIALLKRIVAP